MFSRISWPTLTTIAGGAGMGIGVMILLINKERENLANQATFIKNAVNKIREQPAAISLLGDNFQVGRASFRDGWSKMERLQVRVRVPIKGNLDNGCLYIYAKKKEDYAKLRLFRVEMSFDKVPGKRMVLMQLDDGELQKVEAEEEQKAEIEAKKGRVPSNKDDRKRLMDEKVRKMLSLE